jgi:hypothetical protein
MKRSSCASDKVRGIKGNFFLNKYEQMVKVKLYTNNPKKPEDKKCVNSDVIA